MEPQRNELRWQLLLLGAVVSAIAAAATPYVVLKLGMSADLAYGGMFLAAAVLGRRATSRQLAIELNIIQTMINAVVGVGFMCVILGAFFYIQNKTGFNRDIGFHPAWWQIAVWVFVSANLGVFMGVLPRRMILDDRTLPWPTGQAMQSVAETLTDPAATETAKRRRDALTVSTLVAGFLTFLKDGLGVITAMVGAGPLKLVFGLELAAIGFGMLVPLAVGLSGLLGVWIVATYGDTVGQLAVLSGTTAEHWNQCTELLGKGTVTDFLKNNCGHAAEWVESPKSHFKYMVLWMMWPATAMMIAAALTSVVVSLLRNLFSRQVASADAVDTNRANEEVPWWWVWGGIGTCVAVLVWLQGAWFAMPWQQVFVAVALQPILIIAGARVLGLTGQGPVSLMANATQCVFGILWPKHILQNLAAAHLSADPQASSESTIVSFWVARRIGGRFRTLMLAQFPMILIAALLLPVVFGMLERTYGIGLEDGQLAAPTSLKIASLAIIMEQGLAALPHGAALWSLIGIILGIVLELLVMARVRDANGERQRFGWIPIPSMLGFALILPPAVMIPMAFGSVVSAVWKKFSPAQDGSYEIFAKPVAAGFIAGEAMVGAILLPLLATLVALAAKLL